MGELLFGCCGRFSNWRGSRKWADGRTGNRLGGEDRTGEFGGCEMPTVCDSVRDDEIGRDEGIGKRKEISGR